ncbi:hypothetical protein AB0A05_27035 [Streptomyces sp. NPDC046374]|uniref:hypothetical protein n=1 Tax=Streptomyces sp. NPDC046374 TaxID=3154917 RepID=UPI0033C12F43
MDKDEARAAAWLRGEDLARFRVEMTMMGESGKPGTSGFDLWAQDAHGALEKAKQAWNVLWQRHGAAGAVEYVVAVYRPERAVGEEALAAEKVQLVLMPYADEMGEPGDG